MNLDFKLFVIGFAGLVVGAGTVFALSGSDDSDVRGPGFCTEVEEGIGDQMRGGFVNCFEPSGKYFDVREEIRDSTSISCVCRKKFDGKVQQIKFVEPS